jgi:anti-sigma factor RsiW
MNLQNPNIENDCPREELAAYIDGELAPREEFELEIHLADCRICALGLNEQKRLLFTLDFALETEKEFKLPENFTKIVIANAESSVSGLRCPKERTKAIFVIAGLFLLFLLGIGGATKTVVAAFLKLGEQVLAVGSFAWHLVFNVAFGTAIVLRSVFSQFVYNSAFSILFLAAFFFISLFALLRLLSRYNHS